jgi:hypothetical protein
MVQRLAERVLVEVVASSFQQGSPAFFGGEAAASAPSIPGGHIRTLPAA